MTTLRERARTRLLEALGAAPEGVEHATNLLASTCALSTRQALRSLDELHDEGRVYKTYEQIDGRTHAVWSLRRPC